MPRWLQILLCLVLFNVIMALIWWGLREWGAPAIGNFYDRVGGLIAWTTFIAALATAGAVAYWPRNPDGSRRPLLSRRR